METIKRIDENHIKIDGIIYEKKETKQVKKLPKTWEEFCENFGTSKGTYGISCSKVLSGERPNGNLYSNRDKNLLPSKELAEAMLALCQLIQLRDCYNDGWKPDWIIKNSKHCIHTFKNEIQKSTMCNTNTILTFKTEELRDEFYDNFKDLIEVAKPLL